MSFSDFQLSYQISPIILTGGSSSGVPGGMTPIMSLTQPDAFSDGLPGAGDTSSPDSYFAHYLPLPGATLIENEVGTYPFANQSVAANAIIAQPLKISLLMICPATDSNTYATKLSTMTALQGALKDHINQGGTFSVATPAFLWTNLLLLRLSDVTSGETKQVQMEWQWDFYRPLLTLEEAAAAQNNLMSKMSSGTPVDGDPPTWSGTSPTVGNPPSLAGSSVVPAASNLGGASAASAARSFGTDIFGP